MNIWEECLIKLKEFFSEKEFKIWIKPLKATFKENILKIYTPNKYFLKWVKLRYEQKISSVLKGISPRIKIVFIVKNFEKGIAVKENIKIKSAFRKTGNLFSRKNLQTTLDLDSTFRNNSQSLDIKSKNSSKSREDTKKSANLGASIKMDYNFNNFVLGKANEVARAAAMQVSVNPGTYNPLFIYGGSGLGKTHLMHAIVNYVSEDSPEFKVLYVSSEKFVKDYVEAVRLHSGNKFQDLYRSVDILLVDDIQFIAGKSGSQEEFFHTFNSLMERNRQVVLSCDKYPKEIPKLEDRLMSRFGFGLTVTIDIPDLETRKAILLQKSKQFGFPINQNIAFFIAEKIRSNVRELEGVLRRVLNYAKFHNKDIGETLVYECLKDIISIQDKIIKVDNIQRIVADYYGIKITDLLSRQKYRSVVRPRQVAMTLAKDFTRHSLPEIGGFFGGRDHTTVLHAVRTIKNLLVSDLSLKNDYEILSYKLDSK